MSNNNYNPNQYNPNGYNSNGYYQQNTGGYQGYQPQGYNPQGYNQPPQQNRYDPRMSAVDSDASAALKLVYLKMCIALVISGFVAWFASTNQAYLSFITTHGWAMWVIFGAELLIVFFISSAITKMGNAAGVFLLALFAAINGLALAPIFLVYTHSSIVKTFFITAGTFGAMSIYGYTTSQDLTKFGKIMFMALIGLIIASVVNIFTHSSTFDWIISFAGVIIFVGLTAWDTQKIKVWAQQMPREAHGALSTMGALSLYLDFINLFLYLLRFFGNSRD